MMNIDETNRMQDLQAKQNKTPEEEQELDRLKAKNNPGTQGNQQPKQ